MPVFELHGSRNGRLRAFARAQLPLLAGAVFVTIEGVVALPSVASSATAVSGMVMVLIVSAAFLVLPWERWPLNAMIGLAIVDVAAVALIRLSYYEYLPSAGLLAVFPIVWLAYAFGRWAIALAVLASFFVTLLPVVLDGRDTTNALAWAQILTLPVIMTGLAIAVGEAARQLAASQNRLRTINRDLKYSLQAARDSDLLSRAVFESVPTALAFYDTDHQLVLANDHAHHAAAAAGFSLAVSPYAGPHARRADNITPIPFEDQIIPRALRGELDDHEMEWAGRHGRQRALLANARHISRSDGSQWGTLIAAHDVTALARSLQVKDEFVATVSHELRTPLTSIRGYLEIVADELNDSTPFITNALAIAQRNAERLEQRVHELLRASKRGSDLTPLPTDLTALAARALDTYRALDSARGLDLIAAAGPVCVAEVDPARLEQVLENLISNAVKYTPAPGTITVTCTAQPTATNATDDDALRDLGEPAVTITVTDTGVGMTPDELEQAFDTFWRADQVRREQIQGFGIGLTVVNDIVTAHRGHVDITSEPGAGTTVTVTLPTRFDPDGD